MAAQTVFALLQSGTSGAVLAAFAVKQRELYVSATANPGQDKFGGEMLVNVGMRPHANGCLVVL